MESSDLRFFEIVARTGNLTQAARRLNTVQSNVTAHIKRLEDELGVQLLQRHSRGASLTPAGEELLPFAMQVSRTLEDAIKTVGRNGKRPSGVLRIGTLETTAAVRLPKVLLHFAEEYPEVEVSLQTGTSRELREAVLGHRIDGAFVTGPVRDANLQETAVWEEELVLVGPALFNPKSLRHASEVRVLVFRNGCSYRKYLEAFLTNSGVANIRQIEMGTLEGILGCVVAGLGITLFPQRVVEASAYGDRLSVHKLSGAQTKVPTVFIQRADPYVSSALKAFVKTVVAHSETSLRDVSR